MTGSVDVHQIPDEGLGLGQDLAGDGAGAAAQRGIDGDQEVLLVPVLPADEAVRDHISRDRPDEDKQVGFLQEVEGGAGPAVADRSHIAGGVEGDGSLRAPFRRGRDVVLFQPFRELPGRVLAPVVPAGDKERLLGLGQGFGEGAGIRAAHAARGHRNGRMQGRINPGADDVLRQAHHHGAGAAAHGREHCLGDDFGGPLGVVQDHHALGARVEPRLDIELLERLAVPVRERNQADKEQHRGGVLPCGVQADVGVRRPGAAGNHGDAGTLVHLAIGLGHVGGAALMPADHGLDAGAVQPVEDVQETFPRDNKGAFNPVRYERINNHVTGGFQGPAAVDGVRDSRQDRL